MIAFSECTRAFYSPSLNSIVDLVRPNGNSLHGDCSFEQMRNKTPDLELLDFDVAYDRYSNGHIQAPQEITAEQFEQAFGCMPPVNVRGGGETMSFQLSELYAGNIATIYCRVDGRHFELRNVRTLNHEAIVSKCRIAMLS